MPIFPKIVYMGTCSVLIGLVICIYVCVCVCHLEFDDSNNILVLFFYIIQSFTRLCVVPELLCCVCNYSFIIWQLLMNTVFWYLLSPTLCCL